MDEPLKPLRECWVVYYPTGGIKRACYCPEMTTEQAVHMREIRSDEVVIPAARLAALESIERERNESKVAGEVAFDVVRKQKVFHIDADVPVGTPLYSAPPQPAQFTVAQVREAWKRQYVSPLTPAAPTFSEERTLAWNTWLACARHFNLIAEPEPKGGE